MKNIIFILLILPSLCFSQITQLHINDRTKRLNVNNNLDTIKVNYGFANRVAIDDGYYNGFPMWADAFGNESSIGVYKKSFTHGGAGYLMLAQTGDGGRIWGEDSIRVNGVVIQSTNHSFYRYANGRMVISYKTDTSLKFAFNNNANVNFTASATVILPTVNYTITQCPNKMYETSYHTLLFVYYQVGSNGNPNSAIIMESLDSGATFTQKSIIYTYNNLAPTGVPRWRGNETALCETHPTGVQATSKWIAIVRTEVVTDGGDYFMKFNSLDGGNTWTQDTVTDAGSFVNDLGHTVSGNFYRGLLYSFLTSNSPVSIRKLGDSIYVINGERDATYGYSLKYIVASPDSAINGRFTVWSRPRFIKFYNARTLGSSTDCGYPTPFIYNNHLFVGDYDVSPYNPLPSVSRRCFVETVNIK